MKKQLIIIYAGLIFGLLSFQSCTKEITVDLPNPDAKIVVEGSIENDVPPFVLLSRNTPYFGGFNFNDLSAYFVQDARVRVFTDNGDTVTLQKFCISDPAVAAVFGFNFDGDSVPEICVYTIPDILNWFITGTGSMVGRPETNYHLVVEADSQVLRSTTRIPALSPFDSLQVRNHPDAKKDSLAQVFVYLTFPSAEGRYLRVQTSTNGGPYYPLPAGSVFEYKLFLGQSAGFPIARGQGADEEFNQDSFGYFFKGDTVSVKWSQIDQKVFTFYSTLESDGGDSPFTAPVKVISNIENGLGVWAGYGSTYGSIIIPK